MRFSGEEAFRWWRQACLTLEEGLTVNGNGVLTAEDGCLGLRGSSL